MQEQVQPVLQYTATCPHGHKTWLVKSAIRKEDAQLACPHCGASMILK